MNADCAQTIIAQMSVIILPTIAKDFHIPAGRQQWIISATSVTSACTLVVWGRIADIYGRRAILQIGLALITISCLVTPFAPNEASLDIFRAIAGLGGAASTPTAVGLIFATLPPGKSQVYAVSAFSGGFPVGNIMGNVLGGVVTQHLRWEWTFWIVAMLSACFTTLSLFVIPQSPTAISKSDRLRTFCRQMDWFGALTAVTFLVFLLVSLSEANTSGWTSPWILALLCSSPVILCTFIAWERRLESRASKMPFIQPSLFSMRTFCAAQATAFLFWAAFNNFLVFATFFYQNYLHLSVIDTTLRFLPSGIAGLFAVLVSSQILMRVNGSLIAIWGSCCVSLPCLLFALPIPPSTTYWAYGFPAMVLSTLGSDTLYPCLMMVAMKSVPEANRAMGAAVFQTAGQIGRSVGLALVTAVQISITKRDSKEEPHASSMLAGYRAADWFSFGIGVSAVLVVLYCFRGIGKVDQNRSQEEEVE